jgi:phosphoglycerate dehydrogenase-like enzyme|tara:strand:+ start:3851 stop:4756 length:906 start_codon:yes stop_codon:yes gene_type:complete
VIRVALCVDLSSTQKERLCAGLEDAELVDGDDLSGCDVAFGNPDADALIGAESLCWIQLESVGFGEYADLDWGRLSQRLSLTNLAGFFADPVAETALAGLLGLARGVNDLLLLQTTRTWEGDPIRTRLRSLSGSNVVMVGFGAINQRLAALLAPFNCQITPIRSTTPLEMMDSALLTADIVVCTAPDTPATRRMFDAKRLALLPNHAVFVNLGRGSIVDEVELAKALNTGQIGGAVLDVTEDEPLPAEHPFWNCPNTILTQHSGGGTADELDKKIDVFLANFARFSNGEPLEGIVNIKRGY